MTSKVNPSVAGSGRGSSDTAIQANFAVIAQELTALQNNSGGTRSSGVVRFGAVATQGDTVTISRKGVSRTYEFTNATPTGSGLAVAIGASAAVQATNLATVINNDKGVHLEVSWSAFVVGAVCHVLARDDDSDPLNVAATFTSGSNTANATNIGSKSGSASGKHASFSHSPLPGEVTAGLIVIWLNWAPSIVAVAAYTKTTHAKLAWDGAWTVTVTAPDTAFISIDNSGATDWTANELLIIDAYG
jgi:hypothetical protein